jgi:hypothetical protein
VSESSEIGRSKWPHGHFKNFERSQEKGHWAGKLGPRTRSTKIRALGSKWKPRIHKKLANMEELDIYPLPNFEIM